MTVETFLILGFSIIFDDAKKSLTPCNKILCYDNHNKYGRGEFGMLAYKMNLTFAKPTSAICEVSAKRGKRTRLRCSADTDQPNWEKFNQKLGREKKISPLSIFAYQVDNDGAKFSVLSRGQVITDTEAEESVKKALESLKMNLGHSLVTDFQEITLKEFCNTLSIGEASGLLNIGYRLYGELGLSGVKEQLDSSRRRDGCQLNEYLPQLYFVGKRQAMTHAKTIMGHTSLRDELGRIYAPCNRRCFVGHPAHYVIRAGSRQAARDIVDTLVTALYANKRLSSKRITYYSDFEPCSNMEQSMKALLSHTGNSSVVLEITGRESSSRGRLLSGDRNLFEFLTDAIGKHCKETLFLLVEITDGNQREKTTSLIDSLRGVVDLISISEGMGDAKETKAYLNYMAQSAGQNPFDEGEMAKIVPEGTYTPTGAEPLFRTLAQNRLRQEFYPAYQDAAFCHDDMAKDGPNEEFCQAQLEKLVGLEEPKAMLRRVVAVHQMRKTRRERKMKGSRAALHMVFTGNPGSAKTTVARLLAGILKEKKFLSTGNFVECGRGDLVGKYVGWTAKIVKQKFQEAAGGVLFIDEAYSLLDDSNSFGTEAINTIVQEMENHRDDVVVIFAGYPNKMHDFIESNEGLRSRIAAYLDFPDYNVDELVEILQLMAKERGYRLNKSIIRKCREYFGQVVKETNFGNGRYVRNLLEAAIMRQAERLTAETSEKVTRQRASCLSVKDFAPVKIEVRREKRRQVGFYAMGTDMGEE